VNVESWEDIFEVQAEWVVEETTAGEADVVRSAATLCRHLRKI
jgi:hypothetical protein